MIIGIPRVSLGMPVFNGERFLVETLDSLLAQTFSDFEIVISDNGSTDGTAEICRAYAEKDQRVHYYRYEENRGAAWNYNHVFALARGDYFKWAAHDDLCAPEFLEQCVKVLDSEPAVVVAYPRTTLIDENGKVEGIYVDDLHLRLPEPHQRLHHFFNHQGLCHPVFGLIRSSVLKQTALIGNFPMSDRNLLGELSLFGEFFEISEYLFLRRIHPEISTYVNATPAQVAAWFDPKKKDKLVLARWRRLLAYLTAIWRAPLRWSQRLVCFFEVAHFALVPKKWGGLGEDSLEIVQWFFALIQSRAKSENVRSRLGD